MVESEDHDFDLALGVADPLDQGLDSVLRLCQQFHGICAITGLCVFTHSGTGPAGYDLQLDLRFRKKGVAAMRVKNSPVFLCVLFALGTLVQGAVKERHGSAEKIAASGPARFWNDPADLESRDLFYGPGGSEHAPAPQGTFTFVKGAVDGTSRKFGAK